MNLSQDPNFNWGGYVTWNSIRYNNTSRFSSCILLNILSKIKVPQTLILCDKRADKEKNCGLLQLRETVNPALLYTNYFYTVILSDNDYILLHNTVKWYYSTFS